MTFNGVLKTGSRSSPRVTKSGRAKVIRRLNYGYRDQSRCGSIHSAHAGGDLVATLWSSVNVFPSAGRERPTARRSPGRTSAIARRRREALRERAGPKRQDWFGLATDTGLPGSDRRRRRRRPRPAMNYPWLRHDVQRYIPDLSGTSAWRTWEYSRSTAEVGNRVRG